MSSTALEKREEQIASLKARVSNTRERFEKKATKIQSAAVAAGAAFLFGRYERESRRNNTAMLTIAGMDSDLTIGGIAFIAGELAGGKTGEVIEAAGLGVLCSAAYRRGQSTT